MIVNYRINLTLCSVRLGNRTIGVNLRNESAFMSIYYTVEAVFNRSVLSQYALVGVN